MAKSNDSIQVFERMVCLFDLLAASEVPLTLKQLSIDSRLPSSTVYRILSSLKQHAWICQDEENRYAIGPKITQLAKHAANSIDVREQIKPLMHTINQRTGETVNLSIREGNELVYIERVLSTKMLRVDVAIGKRTPLHATAVGKLILGAMNEAEYNAYINQTILTEFTPHTISCAKKLRAHCVEAAKEGVAYEHEEAELGLGCIAVLLPQKSDEQVHGLSISAPIERLSKDWVNLLKLTTSA